MLSFQLTFHCLIYLMNHCINSDMKSLADIFIVITLPLSPWKPQEDTNQRLILQLIKTNKKM